MAITIPQTPIKATGSLGAGTSTYTLTGLSSLSAGDGIIVGASNGSLRSISSIVLSSTGTTTSLTAQTSAAVSNVIELWKGTASGSETNANIVVTWSGNVNDVEMVFAIVTRGWNSDQTAAVGMNESSASAMSHDIGSITPGAANNILVFATSRGNRSWTDDTNYTIVGTTSNTLQAAYRIQSAANADTYDFSTTDAAAAADMVYAAFAGTADGGATTRSYKLTTLGVS